MSVRLPTMIGVLSVSALLAAPAAQSAPLPFIGPALVQDRVIARAVASMQVNSPVVNADGGLPLVNTGYGKSTSFPISWTPVPDAKGYAVVFEEIDPEQRRAVVYWTAYNIPAGMTALGHAIHTRAQIAGANGFLQGLNSAGGIGYIGPHPPLGDGPHHYHLEVFALSRMLSLNGGAHLDELIKAMNDHVLAEGDLVVTFQPPQPGDLPNGKPAKP